MRPAAGHDEAELDDEDSPLTREGEEERDGEARRRAARDADDPLARETFFRDLGD